LYSILLNDFYILPKIIQDLDWLFNNYLTIYFIIVAPLGALLVWWSKHRIKSIERARAKNISGLKKFEAVNTSTPFDQPVIGAREAALDSLESRFSIIRRLTLISISIIWIIALILPFLGQIPVAFISILVGATSVIIGIAARPFIENLISGIVISFTNPIRIGDTVVIDDNYGTVEDITISHTVIKVWNWRRYIIPNSQMIAKEFTNCTIFDHFQWMHIQFWLSYEADLEQVKGIAKEVAVASKHYANHEQPRFWVMDMEERGYKCWLAVWANSPVDAWELGNDVRTGLILKFRELGIKAHMNEIQHFNPKDIPDFK